MTANEDEVPILNDVQSNDPKLGFTCRRLTVVPAVIGYFLAAGISMYLIPEYLHDEINKQYIANEHRLGSHNWTYDPCNGTKSDPGYARYEHVQKETAKWQYYISLAHNIPAIVANLVWASYSDVIGRKILLISCTAGFLLKSLTAVLVIYYEANIVFLLVGEVVDGVAGTYTTYLAVLFPYIADITETGRKRTIAIVMIELLLGVNVTIATFFTGYLIKYLGYFYPSLIGLGCCVFSLCISIVCIPETLIKKKTGGCRILITGVSNAFKLYFKPESRNKQIKYFLLIISFIFYTIGILNRSSIETVFQLGQPFCWSSTKIGLFGAARMAFISLLGMGGIFLLKAMFLDDTIAIVATALTVISFVVEGLAKSETILYIVPVLSTMSVLPIPMIRSLMSQLTPTEKQGALFASIGAFETLCSLIGSLTGNLVYAATVSVMNGFVFLLMGTVTALAGVILIIFKCIQKQTEDDDNNIQEVHVNPSLTDQPDKEEYETC